MKLLELIVEGFLLYRNMSQTLCMGAIPMRIHVYIKEVHRSTSFHRTDKITRLIRNRFKVSCIKTFDVPPKE